MNHRQKAQAFIALLDLIDENGGSPCQNQPDVFEYRGWYDEQTNQMAERAAKDICSTCPVMAQCLDYAVNAKENENIWGGTTPDERIKLRNPHKPA